MRVTIKKITITTIVSFIIYVALMLSVFSCKTAKKTWVEQTFVSKDVYDAVQQTTEQYINSEVGNLRQDFTVKYSGFLQKLNDKSSETTTVKGTITAEDGKEKSVNIGLTKIVSSGANISFEIASAKEQLKETETKQTELLEQLTQTQTKLQTTQKEVNALKSEIASIKSILEAKTKEQSKTGFTFGFMVTVFLVVLGLLSLWYFRKQIPFLNKL